MKNMTLFEKKECFMPIPWLIGAAIVGAAALIAKASSDDDSSSSSSSEDERKRQKREAKLEHRRDSLTTQLKNLKQDQVDIAEDSLNKAVQSLGKTAQPLEKTAQEYKSIEMSLFGVFSFFKNPSSAYSSILTSKEQSASEYAQSLVTILEAESFTVDAQSTAKTSELLINLKVVESVFSPISLSSNEHSDLEIINAAKKRLEILKKLRIELETQK